MNVSELRIGNLVDSGIGILKISKIQNERGESKFQGWRIDMPMHGQEEKFIKPIPLTEEWLVKFGFIIYGWGAVKNNIYLQVRSDKEYNLINITERDCPNCMICNEVENIIGINIKYVHQLQNLYFALTGDELKTKE